MQVKNRNIILMVSDNLFYDFKVLNEMYSAKGTGNTNVATNK